MVGEKIKQLGLSLDLHVRYIDDIRILMIKVMAGTVM